LDGTEGTLGITALSTARTITLGCLEIDGLTSAPIDRIAVTDSSNTAASSLTATTATLSQASQMALAIFVNDSANSLDVSSRTWSNSFVEFADRDPNDGAPALLLARRNYPASGTPTTTLTYTPTGTDVADEAVLYIVTLKTQNPLPVT
jgi:hypothetical protein